MGYCAAAADDAATAGLAASVAREEGAGSELALAVLDSVAAASKAKPALPARVSLLDYRFLQLMGPVHDMQLVERAEPALLAVLANDTGSDVRMRTAATEAALRSNVLSPRDATEAYKVQPEGAVRTSAGQDKVRRSRAAACAAVPRHRQHAQSRPQGAPAAGAAGRCAARRHPVADGVHARSGPGRGISVAGNGHAGRAGSGNCRCLGRLRGRPALGRDLGQPAALAGIDRHCRPADGPRQTGGAGAMWISSLRAGASAARSCTGWQRCSTRSTSTCPTGIWEAAARIPQPATGYLPETGVLAELAQAAQAQGHGTHHSAGDAGVRAPRRGRGQHPGAGRCRARH